MPGNKTDIEKAKEELVCELQALRQQNAVLEEQLRQAQRIEAIGNLSSGIAHDFNNLLTVINGHAEFALMKMEKNHPLQKEVKSILGAGKRAENLIKQLLAFSRKQVYEAKVIDVNRVITGLDKMMRRLIGEDIQMEMHIGSDIPMIKADPTQIEQILMNLIVNARDAVKERAESTAEAEKRIIIETGRVYLDESYTAGHPGAQEGLFVLLIVSDTGMGMDAEAKEKIFEPFFTTKEKGKGTGLGMSTVYGIVKQNNGNIYVYSEPGQGTTIKVYWPSTAEVKAPEAAGIIKEDILTGKETILLVEDDEQVRKFSAAILKELGYEVLQAGNGKKALELIKEKQVQVDLLLTDMIMPQMNGRELAGKLKEMFPAAGILYTSGYTDTHFMHGGALEEGIHFIQKPYSFQGLGRKVRTALDENKKSAAH